MNNRELVDRVIRIWNGADPRDANEIYSDDFKFRSTTLPEPIHGRDALIGYIGQMRQAFPDFRLTADEIVAEGDNLAVRWTWTGTHRGEWEGIAPTGRNVRQEGLTLVKRKSGKTVEEFVATDQYGLLEQLGVVPARPSQARTRTAG